MLIEKNAEEVELEFDVSSCSAPVLRLIMPFMSLQVEDFRQEMAAALKSYEKYIVCVEKTPEEFLKSLQSLMGKAIQVFENRAAGLPDISDIDPYKWKGLVAHRARLDERREELVAAEPKNGGGIE